MSVQLFVSCDLGEDFCKDGNGYDVEYCKIYKRIELNAIKRDNYEFPYVMHTDTDIAPFVPHSYQGPLVYDEPGGGVHPEAHDLPLHETLNDGDGKHRRL
eukprot:g4828.t1